MCKHLLILIIIIYTHCSYADIINGKYGKNQVFYAYRNTPFPEAGKEFKLSSFDKPYSDDKNSYDIADRYVGFFYTNNATKPIGMQIYNNDGTIQNISFAGNIFGLTHEGFLYVSGVDRNGNIIGTNGTGFATFISNAAGLKYGGSLSYIPTESVAASLAELKTYDATTKILIEGETVLPSKNGTELLQILMSCNNKKAYGLATVIDSLTSQDIAVKNALNAVVTTGDAQAVCNAVDQLLPILAGSAAYSVLDIKGEAYYITKAKNSIQNLSCNKGLWIEPVYIKSSQDSQDNISGYNIDAGGLICGFDVKLSDKIFVGSALSYTNASLNGSKSKDKINSDIYDLMLYGSYAFTKQNELSITSSIGGIRNNSSRSIIIDQLQAVTNATYDSFTAAVGANFTHSTNFRRNIDIKIGIGIDYHYLKNNAYTEQGANSLDLKINAQSIERLIPSAVASGLYHFSENLAIEASLGLAYNLFDKQVALTSEFVNIAGTAFQTESLTQSSVFAKTGLNLVYKCNNRVDISLGYDGGIWTDNLRTSHVKLFEKFFIIIFVNANSIKALAEEVVIS